MPVKLKLKKELTIQKEYEKKNVINEINELYRNEKETDILAYKVTMDLINQTLKYMVSIITVKR